METVCSSANGKRDAKSETLVDGVADFRHVFIYSERKIAPLKLFVAPESFWFCNLLVAFGGLQKPLFPKYTWQHFCLCEKNLSCFTCNGFYNFMEQGSREYFTAASVFDCILVNAPACCYLSKQWIQAYSLWDIYIGQCLFSQNTLPPCWLPSETRLALWISLCIIVPSFSFPDTEAVTRPDSQDLDSCFLNHTLLWSSFPPWHTRLNKTTCFIVREELHLNRSAQCSMLLP